jgi:hypothetical protein
MYMGGLDLAPKATKINVVQKINHFYKENRKEL